MEPSLMSNDYSPRYLPASSLKEKVPFRIEGIYESGRHITLYMREYDCPRQTMTFLLNPLITEAFPPIREFNRQRNVEEATLHFKYCVCAPSNDGDYFIIRISDKRFVKYLF
jgi:hypothetical protein